MNYTCYLSNYLETKIASLNHELEWLAAAEFKAAIELMANLFNDICDDGFLLSSEPTRSN